LTGVVLPLFSILGTQEGTRLYRKKLQNPLSCAALFFGVGMASSLVLVALGSISPVVSVLGMAILTGAMHGVNLMLICMLPPYFQKTGKVSTVSGVLNACTYIGSALSTYMIAFLVEKFGWQLNLQIWLGVTVAGTIVCFLLQKPWKKINEELFGRKYAEYKLRKITKSQLAEALDISRPTLDKLLKDREMK
jgi:OPA family glycerol-3-phosphate transporter-like MFS transporter